MARGGHLGTVDALVERLAAVGVNLVQMPVERLLVARRLPVAGYIMADFDRMHPWQIEIAGKVATRLQEAGLPVLNPPGRFVARAGLLRRLHAAGVNDFTCWLPGFGERPEKFPCFLRTIHSHRGVLSGLLDSAEAAEEALQQALAGGHVLCDLVFIEYRHAPPDGDDGRRRKLACYRVGAHIIPALAVTEYGWPVRHGQVNSATPEDYARDLAETRDYPHEAALRRAFDVAECSFGRADFGVVDGRPQIYEINTNPYLGFADDHPNADRRETDAVIARRLVAAVAELAQAPNGPAVDVSDITPSGSASSRRTLRQP